MAAEEEYQKYQEIKGDAAMNEGDVNQELYEIHYVFQEGTEDKIYYIVARSLINAIDRF